MNQHADPDLIRNEMLRFLNDSHGLNEQAFSSEKPLKDFGIDSFKIIELILFVENKFDIFFPETSYTAENLRSIDSILAALLQIRQESSK